MKGVSMFTQFALREMIITSLLTRLSNNDCNGIEESAKAWYDKGVLTLEDYQFISSEAEKIQPPEEDKED